MLFRSKTNRLGDVFTVGIKTVIAGFFGFCLFAPILRSFDMISGYALIIYLYVLFGMLKSVTAQFVRSMGLVKLFALDGFLETFTTIVFNIIFLSVFSWGIEGYISSIIASNIVSTIFLFSLARLTRYLNLTARTGKLQIQMLKYSIPDRKITRLNSIQIQKSRMPTSACKTQHL